MESQEGEAWDDGFVLVREAALGGGSDGTYTMRSTYSTY